MPGLCSFSRRRIVQVLLLVSRFFPVLAKATHGHAAKSGHMRHVQKLDITLSDSCAHRDKTGPDTIPSTGVVHVLTPFLAAA